MRRKIRVPILSLRCWKRNERQPKRRKLPTIVNFQQLQTQDHRIVDFWEKNFFRGEETYYQRRPMKSANENFAVSTEWIVVKVFWGNGHQKFRRETVTFEGKIWNFSDMVIEVLRRYQKYGKQKSKNEVDWNDKNWKVPDSGSSLNH